MDVLLDIKNIKGIGPTRARLLYKMGIHSIKDVLFYFPRDYLDLTPLTFKQGMEDTVGAYPCIVIGLAVSKKVRSGIYITKLPITDGQNKGYAVFFNQPYIGKSFYRNQKLLLIGKMKKNFGVYEISSPEWIKFEKDKRIEIERICPIYPLSKGISQKLMKNTVKNAINSSTGPKETLPEEILNRYNLLSLKQAIKNIHFPQSFKMLEKARERFIFEELLLFQLYTGLSRYNLKAKKRKNSYKNLDLKPFLSGLPFSPTSGQLKVLNDVINDLKCKHVMNRLVQGDVGSGKTLIACAALYLNVKNGFQGVMMVPTEILADQHYHTL
ncbi:MAG: DEAD/DEAH box helicase, partial [Tepidanaerobacteraceae bacterium]|nr:DEAD/DEAH box helicase [Tepidanaerobacteraceae bacterium]